LARSLVRLSASSKPSTRKRLASPVPKETIDNNNLARHWPMAGP
jgi:hypothetical protein